MTYYTIPPPAKLSNFVRCFWILESEGPSYVHRSMADCCAEMVFHYDGQFEELVDGKSEKSSLTALQGPSTQIRRFKIERKFGIFGVYLFPYSIPLFFQTPATELYNQMPDLISFLGKEGQWLEERILSADNNHERIKIITQFFEDKLENFSKYQHSVISSIRHVIQSDGLIKIEKLAQQYCVSERQFERKFKESCGLTPKLFSRIVRFHSACREFGKTEKSLTEIAYECGYYDQSHFIHEFKEFSGYYPKHYFSGHAEGTEWRTA